MSTMTVYEAFEANADLSAKQYRFVTNSANNRVDQVATLGAAVTGILQDKPSAAGRNCTVAMLGRSRLKAGATIVAGAHIASTASGTGITAASGNYVAGIAITGVASGGEFDVMLTHAGYTIG